MGLFETVAPCDLSRELESMIKSKSGANNPLNIDWTDTQMITNISFIFDNQLEKIHKSINF